MSDPVWKKMVEELRARGSAHPAVERLHAQLQVLRGAPMGVEAEILMEMGSSLRRAEEKIDVALVQAEALGHQLDAEPQGTTAWEDLRAKYDAAREEAIERVRHLRIQREAIGFRRHDGMNGLYPIPPRR